MNRHLAVLTTVHPTNDKRVLHRFVESFLNSNWRVSWVGPDTRDDDRATDSVNWLTYDVSSGRGGRISRLRTLQARSKELDHVDLVFTPNPDAAIVVPGIARGLGARTVMDLQEFYAQVHLGFHLGPRSHALAAPPLVGLLRQILRRFDMVLGVTQPLLDQYAPKHPHRLVMLNTPRANFLVAANEGASQRPRNLTVLQGVIANWRGTSRALTEMAATGLSPESIQLVGVGDPTEASSLGLAESDAGLMDYISWRERRPYEQMPALTGSCHIGLIDPAPYTYPSLPNRLFEYMAAGLPVLAAEQADQIANIVNRHKCGILFDMESTGSLGRAILALAEQPELRSRLGSNGQSAFLEFYSWESQFARLISLVDEVGPA